eukprot:3783187-Prymnesium_polylepis.1
MQQISRRRMLHTYVAMDEVVTELITELEAQAKNLAAEIRKQAQALLVDTFEINGPKEEPEPEPEPEPEVRPPPRRHTCARARPCLGARAALARA